MKSKVSQLIAVIGLSMICLTANGDTLAQYVKDNKLTLSVILATEQPLLVRQQIIFNVELATEYWINGNIKFDLPEIDGAIVLPSPSEVESDGRQVNGKFWDVQKTKLIIHPLHAGSFILPAFPINIKLQGENNVDVSGKLLTNPISFEITQPDELQNEEHFVVTTEFKLDYSTDIDDAVEYKVGQAVTEVIKITAKEVPAMMLPKIALTDLTGIEVYQKTPELKEDFNEKTNIKTSSRIETINYILKQPGEYNLPERRFVWWDSAKQTREESVIPALHWRVGGVPAQANKPEFEVATSLLIKIAEVIVLTLVILAPSGLLLRHFKTPLGRKYQQVSQSLAVRKAYLRAVQQQDYRQACRWLFPIVDSPVGSIEPIRQKLAENPQAEMLLERLYALAFSQGDQAMRFGIKEAKLLLKALQPSRWAIKRRGPEKFNLKLNQ